jgi:hypothetical protein
VYLPSQKMTKAKREGRDLYAESLNGDIGEFAAGLGEDIEEVRGEENHGGVVDQKSV